MSTAFPYHNRDKTECKYGHKFTPANTRISKANGQRVCLACARRRDRNRSKP